MGNSPKDQPVATNDEVGIFINSDGDYRILLPHEWSLTGQVPEFAFLCIAALVRISRRDEVEFRNMLSSWARQDLQTSEELRLPKNPRGRKQGKPN